MPIGAFRSNGIPTDGTLVPASQRPQSACCPQICLAGQRSPMVSSVCICGHSLRSADCGRRRGVQPQRYRVQPQMHTDAHRSELPARAVRSEARRNRSDLARSRSAAVCLRGSGRGNRRCVSEEPRWVARPVEDWSGCAATGRSALCFRVLPGLVVVGAASCRFATRPQGGRATPRSALTARLIRVHLCASVAILSGAPTAGGDAEFSHRGTRMHTDKSCRRGLSDPRQRGAGLRRRGGESAAWAWGAPAGGTGSASRRPHAQPATPFLTSGRATQPSRTTRLNARPDNVLIRRPQPVTAPAEKNKS